MSNQLLIEQCRGNNRKAQMQLYGQYCDGMIIVANRYLNDRGLAEDAMQDAFIKAFQKINQFQGDVTFGAWLKRIVINTCLDKIKLKKIVTEPIRDEMMGVSFDQQDWSAPDSATVTEINTAIAKLPERYRIVIQLFLLEGYDHNEISEILEITESASRTNLHRGKLKLKESLKHLRYGTGY